MNEPRRLREEGGSALELALLEAGRSVGASTRTRTKALAALGLAAGPLAAAVAPTQAVGALAGGAAAAPAPGVAPTAMGALAAKTPLATTLGKVVAGLTLAGVTAAVPLGTMAWRHYRPAATVASSSAPERVEPREETAKTQPEAPVTGRGLGRELVALDAARVRLAKGDTAGALGALDDYGRQFPNGRLALEAEVLRIDALARSGRRDAAKARAAAFLRNNPGNVLAPRVRGYLGD
jgi:hypothetical protein